MDLLGELDKNNGENFIDTLNFSTSSYGCIACLFDIWECRWLVMVNYLWQDMNKYSLRFMQIFWDSKHVRSSNCSGLTLLYIRIPHDILI